MKQASRFLLAFGLALALSACGGGGSSTSASGATSQGSTSSGNSGSSGVTNGTGTSGGTTSGTTGSTSASSTVVWTATPATPGKILIASPDNTIAAGAIVTFGQAFPTGEMSSAHMAAVYQGASLPTQVDVKRLHGDGSIRHAVISVRLPASTSSIALQLTSTSAAASSPAPLSLTAAQASAADFEVRISETTSSGGVSQPETGKTWSVSLKQAMADNNRSWLSGALVSEWRSVGVPKNGSTSHPNLRVMFDARFQGANQGRVSIAIENTLANASRGDRSYNVQILDSAGQPLFSENNVVHFAHSRWRKIFNFGGAKELMALLDIERLKAARSIPNYATITMPESTIASRYTDWQNSPRGLYQFSLIRSGMGGTGGREDIGPLPGWVAAALVSRDARLYQAMFDQADRAGNFGIHYRKPATQDVYSIDDHPTITLNESAAQFSNAADKLPAITLAALTSSSTVLGEPDRSHQPSLAYVPYLVTGDYYYLEELHFWNAYNLMTFNFAYRDNAKGLVNSEQMRGQAWTLRTMGHGAWIAPDSDWQKNYLTTKITNNMNWFRTNMMPNNPLGYWSATLVGGSAAVSYPSPSVTAVISAGKEFAFAPWQHNFMAYTLYELSQRGLGAADVRDYALGFTVRLYTSGSDYNKYDGPAYYLAGILSTSPTVVYANTMAAIYNNSFYNRPLAEVPTNLPYFDDPNGYSAIAGATLAAAVDSGLAKSSEAYVFVNSEMMDQPKTSNIYRSNHVTNPTWNIIPFSSIAGLAQAPGIYPR